jgi:pyruvate dehydrogenase E2 component (dihydrolipoamide acetyltransferase)
MSMIIYLLNGYRWFIQVDIYSLSRKWKELVDKARAKQLQPHEYNSGILSASHTNSNM